MLIAQVIVELSLDRKFDYLIPEELSAAVRPGVRVEVPFGKSTRVGCVLSVSEVENFSGRFELKPVLAVKSNSPQLPEKLLQLGSWMADYYCCSYEQAVKALLPGAVRRAKSNRGKRRFALNDLAAADEFIRQNSSKKTAAKRIAVLQTLMQEDDLTADEIELRCGATASVIKGLLELELLVISSVDALKRRKHRKFAVAPDKPRTPTAEQQAALDGICQLLDHPEWDVRTGLLFGVTGSGKTEVYLQSIAHALKLGKSAIVLVPEISLTPQTVRRFRARFGDALAVLHSRLSDAERREEWQKIYNGQAQIAIGARSALFAPLANLGLIVVDEEHENSYKQAEAPRYSARDVAVMRGKIENAAVVLGSATPALETYYNALNGKYKLWKLEHRAEDSPLPEVRVVDLALAREHAKEHPGAGSTLFTPELISAIKSRLHCREQVILFLNRRGYARELACPEELCTWVAECPDCSKSYIYHRSRQMLSCGLCGRIVPAPVHCPVCNAEVLRTRGVGTERIEDIARRIFPHARIERMDSDTMRGADAHEITLEKFRRGELDILIGTQMIAKGLDFPNVTLVGVINADSGLNIPDIRASERTFQLLTQVAGRAGRGDKHGEVIIQTFSPYNDVIRYAVAQDFPAFYEYDAAVRQVLNYPPFGHLIALYARGENESEVSEVINAVFLKAKSFCHASVIAVEPAPAPLARVKGKYRYLATFRGEKISSVRRALRQMVLHEVWKNSVELYLDMDAQTLI
ncbi:MAG: primosomal protein N' [Lentisphaerae bacterium]|nr:primosomal protein N' [Lentisphaerota bacterium]